MAAVTDTYTISARWVDGPHKRQIGPAVLYQGRIVIDGEVSTRRFTYKPDPRPFDAPLWVMWS